MNHPLGELEELLGTLDELSGGKAQKYVMAAEKLGDDYLRRLEDLGIRGLVLMPWADKAQPAGDLDIKLESMRQAAGFWR
ncbi:MAG: hypothetical protein IPF49_15065 [Gammaproteobacteria bacterium]|nr:hypothetical protein [Gammaproteobacteria bacterium]